MAALRGPGTAALKRRPGTAVDIDEALEAVNKELGRHGARCTARMHLGKNYGKTWVKRPSREPGRARTARARESPGEPGRARESPGEPGETGAESPEEPGRARESPESPEVFIYKNSKTSYL
jgi:hypothetical protein